jgi:hypothetical protein
MHSKKLISIILSSAVIATQGLYRVMNSSTLFQTSQKKDNIKFISYCDLVHAPEKYSGLTIQTKAIVVAVIGPTADGYTILYSPGCNEKDQTAVVSDDKTLLIPEDEYKKLDRALRSKKTERLIARVEITVTGKFKFPMNNTINKHQPSLEIISLEEIAQVNDDVPWPVLP